jgi:hypothetical protein
MTSDLKEIRARTVSEAAAKVARTEWGRALIGGKYVGRAVFEYDTSATRRSELLAEVAAQISREYGPKDPDIIVRQRSSLTSFSLPCGTRDAIWANLPKYPWLKPAEREALEKAGKAYQLMIDPNSCPDGYSDLVQVAKLRSLRTFLKSKPKGGISAVVRTFLPTEGLTIIGNYWVLQSAAVGPSQETRHSISTWHAPTVNVYCRDFEEEFEPLWTQSVAKNPEDPLSDCLAKIDDAIKYYSRALGVVGASADRLAD